MDLLSDPRIVYYVLTLLIGLASVVASVKAIRSAS